MGGQVFLFDVLPENTCWRSWANADVETDLRVHIPGLFYLPGS